MANKSVSPVRDMLVRVTNGFQDAIFGPGNTGTQLNQTTTLFQNNRWYLISNMRQLLSECYVEQGLIQTIVNVPVDDAFRGGVVVKTKQLSEDELTDLHAEMELHDDIGTVALGKKWTRLFGGGAVIIITDQDPSTPFDVDSLTEDSLYELRAVDLWELFYDKQNTEGYDPTIQEHKFEFYNYYGVKLHKSRVMKMKGMTAPSFIRPRLRGWGLSVVEGLINSINQYLKSNNLTFEVLDEFKLDVFKFKNLANTLLSPAGTAQIQTRVQIANQQKNYQHAIAMDAEDDYTQKQLTFAGIADMMREFRMQIACDMRMPISKIFGVGASGFSSGEDDIENYNAMIESTIRTPSKPHVIRVVKMRCQKMFGKAPDDLSISYHPLRVLSAKDEEDVKEKQFNRMAAAYDKGLMSPKDFKDACNKNSLLPVQLDPNEEVIEMEPLDEDGGGGDAPKDKDPKEKKEPKG